MADELTTTSQLIYDDGVSSPFTLGGNTIVSSMGNAALVRGKIIVGTSEEALNKGDVVTIGRLWIKNLDDTNWVEVKTGTGGISFLRVDPNSEELINVGSGVTAPYIIANVASCNVEYCLFAR